MGSKLPPLPPEVKRFHTVCRKLLSDVAAYVADGGDVQTNSKIEIALWNRCHKLYDKQRAADLLEDASCAALEQRCKSACKAMGDEARATRQKGYDAEIARLRVLEREAKAKLNEWRDPPRRF
jgi:ATPase subunit of ABC transporter with duplicated ATPase domains